jgi:flavin reductase (DIM6/NTAB) family NADH-FMN oxidoreductase RutF
VIIDPKSTAPAALYQFMISVVVPRPIAFVSTMSPDGRLNLAPFSYFNPLTNEPPLLGISINRRRGERKDTLRNVEETGEFVVNVVTEAIAERMVKTSGEYADDVDEFQIAEFTPAPSQIVRPPRVGESPVNMECRLHQVIELGATFFVIGEILLAHVDEAILTDGRVDVAKLRPVGRLGGDGYSVVRDVLHLQRPRVAPQVKPAG